MSTILEDLSWRYATKKFDASKVIPEDKILILKEAFNQTATSFGLQPVRLIVVKDDSLKDQLVAHSMNQQQVGDASHVLVFCIEKNINTNYINKYFDRIKAIRSTPEEILEPYHKYLIDHFNGITEEEIDIWATKQAYLAMGNLLTVCAVEKIDACPMEGFSPSGYDSLLSLNDKDLQAVLVMPVGYRAADDMFSSLKKVRKPLEEIIIDL